MARKRRSRRKKQANSWIGNVGILLLLVAIIYILLAGKLGTWIADNIISPISSTQPPEGTQNPNISPSPISQLTGEIVTKEIETPLLKLYALQLGAYQEAANANTAAESVRTNGAAGYVISHENLYRVLGAVYGNENDAESVKKQLVESQSIECGVLLLQSDTLVIKITAEEDCIAAIEQGFDAWIDFITNIREISLEYDKGSLTFADAKARLTETINTAKTISTNLEQLQILSEGITLPGEIAAELKTCAEQAETINNSNETDFSWKLKHTSLKTADAYLKYIGSLGN